MADENEAEGYGKCITVASGVQGIGTYGEVSPTTSWRDTARREW